MQFKINEQTHEASTPLMIIICRVITYCDNFNLPLNIVEATNDRMIINLDGWTSQLTHKFMYHLKSDYNDLTKTNVELATLYENKLLIEVNPHKRVNKFE